MLDLFDLMGKDQVIGRNVSDDFWHDKEKTLITADKVASQMNGISNPLPILSRSAETVSVY